MVVDLSKAGLTGKYGEPRDHRWIKIWAGIDTAESSAG